MGRLHEWPVFHMAMQCPGFLSIEQTESGSYKYVDRICDKSRYSGFTVVHGDFVIELSVCDHVRRCHLSDSVQNFLAPIYDDFRHRQSVHDEVVAFRRFPSHQYVWQYSTNGSCRNCGKHSQISNDYSFLMHPREFIEGPGKHSISSASLVSFKQLLDRGYYPKSDNVRFCSVSCAAEYIGTQCPTCGAFDKNTIVNRFASYSKKICDRVGVSPWSIDWNFCSRQCCSLALDAYLRNEREERKRKKNLKCVLEVKKVLSKAKLALQKRDSQEALQSLKKAFEQAASSL